MRSTLYAVNSWMINHLRNYSLHGPLQNERTDTAMGASTKENKKNTH